MTRLLLAPLAALGIAAAPLAAQSPTEQAAQLATPTGVLHGTLMLPATPGPHPVALVIAGSGPTDRNGNIVGMGPNESLRRVAEGLAAHGIASLRYDKRTIGASAGVGPPGATEADLRFDHFVDDAARWIVQLRADRRFSGVAVIGHSEGSLVGMLAARAAAADRFVSIAGMGRPMGRVLRDQLRPAVPPELYGRAEAVLSSLEAGRTQSDFPAELASIFRGEIQPYMISVLRYDPAVEIARLTVPTLIVQGTTDLQVRVTEAEALAAARPEAKLVLIEGMNHVLKTVSGDLAQQWPSYSNPTLPLTPGLVDALAAFLAR
ncbi:MAG TPA: alpha/beta fold hydrolase [Longimicrobiaceae bacterium]|nr:alpha/beta fold hydrolase [Longimicrobiaceae bacterium]